MVLNRHISGVGFVSSAVLIFLSSACCIDAHAQQLPKHLKPYSESRLTADDFQGNKTAATIRKAYTWTQIRYDFNYRYETRGEVTTAKLTKANVFAVFDRNVSWNVDKNNASLLGHEQGHFEVTQSFALKIHLALLKQVKSATPIKATGTSEQDAAMKIGAKIRELVDQINGEMVKAHQEYDRLTRHGLSAKQQNDFRKKQHDSLTFLNDEIKRLSED